MASERIAVCDDCNGITYVPSEVGCGDDAPVPDWFRDQVLGGEPFPDAEWD